MMVITVPPSDRADRHGPTCSDLNDGQESFQPGKVLSVSSDQGQLHREGRGGNEHVGEPRPRLSALLYDRGVNTSIGSGGFNVERERIEDRLRALQPILTSRPFGRVDGGRRARAQLSE